VRIFYVHTLLQPLSFRELIFGGVFGYLDTNTAGISPPPGFTAERTHWREHSTGRLALEKQRTRDLSKPWRIIAKLLKSRIIAIFPCAIQLVLLQWGVHYRDRAKPRTHNRHRKRRSEGPK
jgi:hypothetical protein